MRLSTKEGQRISQANSLDVHLGGAEFNVAVNMANLGYNTTLASIVPDNPIGDMTIEYLNRYNVKTTFINKKDGRLGTYYLEQGNGLRSATVTYDRQYSSFAINNYNWDLNALFKDVSLLHVSGITLALSPDWLNTIVHIIKFAKNNEIKVSFDMNYRSKLWNIKNAISGFQKILPFVDYCSANDLDAKAFFNIDEGIKDYYSAMKKRYPNIKLFYATKRNIISASHHELQGIIWTNGSLYKSKTYNIYPIIDRIGSGDAYTSGILHGILSNMPFENIVDFATISAVLKHTINGDVNIFKKDEIESNMDDRIAINR